MSHLHESLHPGRKARATWQSSMARAASEQRANQWTALCTDYVASQTRQFEYSPPSIAECALVGDTSSFPPFAPDSLFQGLETQSSTLITQPRELTGSDYPTKNPHGLPGGMIGDFVRAPEVQAVIQANIRDEAIGAALDHPDVSVLPSDMRMAATIYTAGRRIDQGVHRAVENTSRGVSNLVKGFSRAREALSTIWGHAKSFLPDFSRVPISLRMATAAAVASGLMTACAGSIPVPSESDPRYIQAVTPILPANAIGIIPVEGGTSNQFQFPDITIEGRPLFGKGKATLRASSGTCTIAIPEDLQYKDRLNGLRPTALVIKNPIFDVYRNPIVGPNLGSQWYLLIPTLRFENGEQYYKDPVLVSTSLVNQGPYDLRCYDEAPQTNFAQAFSEMAACTTTAGNPYSKFPGEQPRMSCTPTDRFSRGTPDGSYTSFGTIRYSSPPVSVQMPLALPDARNATKTPARPTATPTRPPEQSIPKGPIYTLYDLNCNTGNGSVPLGQKLENDVVQKVSLDNDGVNQICIFGKDKYGDPTGAVTYRRPKDGQFVPTGRLQYDRTNKCFRDSKTLICLGGGDNYYTK